MTLDETYDLTAVLNELHNSEINAGVETFHDSAHRVWLGDRMNGRSDEGMVSDLAEAAGWLHETALNRYPDSEYAKYRNAD